MKNMRRSRRELLGGFVAVVLIAVLAYWISGKKLDTGFATAFAGLATGLSIIVAVVTLRTTQRANTWSSIAAVHSRFNEQKSYQARGYLFTTFRQHLAQAAKNTLGQHSVSSGHVDIEWILKNVGTDEEMEKKLNSELNSLPSGVEGMSALGAVERVLLDFDLIAAPFCDGDDSAHVTAHTWKPVLKKTSESILPLVAIKTKLRGPSSPYKHHYLRLLHDIGIDLRGLSVPRRP